MKLKRGITSLVIAGTIGVCGYTLVNKGPVDGMSAGIPFVRDKVVTESMDTSMYESNSEEVTTNKEYVTSSAEKNILEYESYTPTHQDDNGKFTRNKTTFRVSDLSDDELQYYIDEFKNNVGNIYVDGKTEKITVDESKGAYSSLKVSKLNKEDKQERLQTAEEDAHDIRFAGAVGLASLFGGLYFGSLLDDEKSKTKVK